MDVYAISNVSEAMDYARDQVLCARLLMITTTVAEQLKKGVPLTVLMGSRIDALKLVSSLTLFQHVAKTLHEAAGEERHRMLVSVAQEVLRRQVRFG